MKHKLLCIVLIVQFLLVCFFIVYESTSLKNAPSLTINTSVDYLFTRSVELQIADSKNIPVFENDYSVFEDANYDKAYLVFDSQKNEQGFNDVLYICKNKPINNSFVEVRVDYIDKEFDEKPTLYVYFSLEYKLSSKDYKKIKLIRDDKDDDNKYTEDDVLVKAFVKVRNNRFFDSVFCESIEIDNISF